MPNKEDVAMENYSGSDQRDLWTYLLLLNGGIGGRGYGYGAGAHAGGGFGCGPSIADEVATHTLKVPTCADLQASSSAQEARINDVQRGVGEIGRDLQNTLASITRDQLSGLATTQAQLAACCCETQKEILESRHSTELGFKDLSRALCDVERNLADKMTEQENARLNRELGDCKAALSNANQTSQLSAIVAQAVASGVGQITSQCCCDPCSKGHHGGGRGGLTAVDIQNIVLQTMAGGGWTPPGQTKAK